MRIRTFALLALLLPGAAFGTPTGFRSLLVDPGVVASGMGYAYTAVADDPSALYWNPAGLVRGEPGYDILLAHTEWFIDYRMEYATLAWNRGGDAIAAGISGFYVGDIERRDSDPSTEPLGDFASYDIVVSFAYARAFGPFRAGLTAKPFYTKIDRVSAHGVAVDLGAQWDAPVEGLTLGAAMANLGNEPSYVEEPFSLPVDFRGGAAYSVPLGESVLDELLISAEVRESKDEDTRFHTGAAVRLMEAVSLRFGYKFGYDEDTTAEESYAFGLGVDRGIFSVQYAVVPFRSDFGTVHRFGIGLQPPRIW